MTRRRKRRGIKPRLHNKFFVVYPLADRISTGPESHTKGRGELLMKLLIGVILICIIMTGYHLIMTHTSYTYNPTPLPKRFDEYYQNQLTKSKALSARPNNEEKLNRYSKKTPVSILYIHGYGASRAEGEYVMDQISEKYQYNTYYMRLPGFGTKPEDMGESTMQELLDESTKALMMMDRLGDKVMIVGSSMGGAIATYLAATYPEKVDRLVLCSPAYAFASTAGRLITFYPLFKLMSIISPVRVSSATVPQETDNWTLYWHREQPFKALKQLIDIMNFVNRPGIFENVKTPTLLIYYYKDEKKQDSAASVSHMLEAFSEFNMGTPLPLSRKVAIENGNHVLTSKYIESDYAAAIREIENFIEDSL
jgi:pimeloyl-ACP methyl ester carboxylesterase